MLKHFINKNKISLLALFCLLFFLILIPKVETQNQTIPNQVVPNSNNYKNTSEASSLAKLITVKFFSKDGISVQGSGFLLNRSLDKINPVFTYLVLTNAHVVRDSDKDIYIEMHDKAIYPVKLHPSNEKLFTNNEDVKILYFNSSVDYAVPPISNTEKLKFNRQVIVSGYPCVEGSICDISVRTIKTYQGNAEVIKKLVRGYNLTYDVSSESGSSGGPVIWNNSVIGINGIGPGTALTNSQYEYSDGSKRSSGDELDKLKKSSLGISLDSLKLDSDNKQLFDSLPKTEKDVRYYPFYTKQPVISSSVEAKLNQLQEDAYTSRTQIIWMIFAATLIGIICGIAIIRNLFILLHSRIDKNHTKLEAIIKEKFEHMHGIINANSSGITNEINFKDLTKHLNKDIVEISNIMDNKFLEIDNLIGVVNTNIEKLRTMQSDTKSQIISFQDVSETQSKSIRNELSNSIKNIEAIVWDILASQDILAGKSEQIRNEFQNNISKLSDAIVFIKSNYTDNSTYENNNWQNIRNTLLRIEDKL